MFALVDCNNFYASCERVFNPALNGKPVVILSNNDGCVIARSNEAKAIGIPMGAVAFTIKEIVKKFDVKIFSSNYTLYGDMSNRVMMELGKFAPEMEIYSIDEAFLNFKGFDYENLQFYSEKIRKTVSQNTGIPISLGVAPTKTLAKMANLIAKKDTSMKGVYLIDSPEKIEDALLKTNIENVWGIGRRYAKLLNANKIYTAKDFTLTNDIWIQKYLKVVGIRIKQELLGNPCIALEMIRDKQNILNSRSFGKMVSTFPILEEAVANFASSCAYKLRKQKSCAKVLMVFITTNPYIQTDPQYAKSCVVQLPIATNSSIEILKYAQIALKKIYKEGYRYKKAGVLVHEIVPENQIQTGLFEEFDAQKHKKVMKAMDKMNLTFGRGKVKIALQGTERKWKMQQEKLSQNFTTRWDEILEIHCIK